MTSGIAHFRINAAPDAQTLPRLINYFAQRNLTPISVRADMMGESLHVSIDQPCLDPEQALIIAEKMRASFLVQHVVVSIIAPSASATGKIEGD